MTQEEILQQKENELKDRELKLEKIQYFKDIEVLQSILDKNELTNADVTMLIEKIVVTETEEVSKYNMPKLDIEINWNAPFII
ncbi:hypothetical protein [Clostridium pasteurianum]|uniref:Uncharacterized protein n=1 Tax=Clostridium pasteurianum BC1 TaxID=86416 RepID=R4K8V4_CLOPA|nr:hypothetical protein [Clostridium pasteurianum]AGK96974.1 hypothetical protein Clopa_2092 [Clostridium pasteurianum BC1]